ncbi:hypothetical protein RB653_010182 [Dictyostelium firmibasis]|uniref:Uncharacterized protein n=1 Tax=Dictyostelium firmibasis TaxID=79012 RepID=A0AAN7TTL8_9MYCE
MTTTTIENGASSPIIVSSSTPKLYQEGAGVWIPDQELGWIGADVIEHLEATPDQVLVRTEDDREIKAPLSKVFQKNPDILEGVDDLSFLSHLHEPAILHNLHHRYNLNQIYTYIGKILIAINPYTSLPLYGKEMISAYYGKQLGTLAPHVYAVAEDAFKDMRYDGTSQSILVSGESGAGKTETTKFLLQYFAAMGNMIKESTTTSSSTNGINTSSDGIPVSTPPPSPMKKSPVDKSIEERVLESTPLLEAFGNAKTLRNDNSSRFGKFIEIHFNEMGSIIGAKILTYLLEKSRIVRQVYNERNYHIFYQLLSGASEELKEKLNLKTIEEYNYLNKSGCFEIEGVSDEEHFNKTCHAMQVAGISLVEQENVFRILSAILLIGNFEFENIAGSNDDSCQLIDRDPLEKVAVLLGCTQADELLNSMLTRKVVTGKESYISHNTKERAENARDSLSMFLYGMMFDWLVVKINSSMSISTQQKSKSFIGVLDIYGFESFEVNGFEQFCINYANEKLQQLFNQHVFKEEQQEYIKEKIDWSYIDFNDNQDTLDLIEKKPICILTLLDEETMFPKATPQTLATKLYSKMTSHSKFEKPRFSSTAFTINHYAGKVTYETDQFLDKNKDFIIPEQISILQRSTFSFIKVLMSHSDKFTQSPGGHPQGNGPPTSSNTKGTSGSSSMKFLSVGSQFSTSLATLMRTISTTTPHYVRCIKPNPEKLPQTFNKQDVIHQLRCGGVMESVRICCAGFPTRRLLSEFYQRYKILYVKDINNNSGGGGGKKGSANKIKDPKVLVQNLLTGIELSDDKYKIGLTKVFLRAGQLASLEDMRLEQLDRSATVIQKRWKGYLYCKRYKKLRDASLVIQTKLRSVHAKQQLSQLQRTHSAILIQKVWRGYRDRVHYNKQRDATLQLQTVIRRHLYSEQVHKERCENAAIILQTKIRQTLAKKDVDKKLRGIILIQARWRGKLAKRLYIQLRAEARSLRTVQEQKNKLQEKLEELQWRLTSEAKRKQQLEEQKLKSDTTMAELQANNDHLQLQLSEIQLKYQELDNTNQSNQSQLSECLIKLEDLTQQLEHSTRLNKKLEKDLTDQSEHLQKLQLQYDETDKQLQQFKQQSEEFSSKLSKTTQQLDFNKQEFDKLVQERDNDNTNNQLEIQQLKKANSTLEEDYFSLSGIRDNLERQVLELRDENQSTKERLDSLTQQSTQLQSVNVQEKQQLESTLQEQSQQLVKLSAEKLGKEDEFKKQLTQMELEIQENKTKLTTQSQLNEQSAEKIKKLKSKLEQTDEDKKHLQQEIERVKQSKQSVEDEKNSLNTQLTTIKLESTQVSTNVSHQKEKITTLKSTIDELNKSINRLQSDQKTKDDELRKVQFELNDQKQQYSRQSKEFSDLQSQSSIDRQKSEITIHSLERTNETLKSDYERVQQSLKQQERDCQQYKDTTSRLENEVKQLIQLKERFENEFFVAKEQNSNQTQESVYLKEVTTQMQQNQSRIERELEEKKQHITRIDDERDELKKQFTQLQQQHEQSSTQLLLAQTELERLRKKEQKYKERGHETSKQQDQFNMEIQSLRIANNDHLKSLQDYEQEKKKLKEKLSTSKQEVQQQRESIIKMEAELSAVKQHSQWVENSFTDMKQRNQELIESSALYKQQLAQQSSSIDSTIKEKEFEISKLSQQLQASNQQLISLKEDLSSMKNSNQLESDQQSKQLSQLIEENQQLKSNANEIAKQLESAVTENHKINNTIKEQELKSKRMSVELQQHIDEGKQQEIQQLQSTIAQLKQQQQSETGRLEKEIQQLKHERENQMRLVESTKVNYHMLEDRMELYRNVMEIIDHKETEWEKLARLAGCKELETKLLSDFLLSCKLEHTSLGSQVWFHQIDYWCPYEKDSSKGIFFGIIRSIVDFTIKNFDDVDLLSYLLACCSLTLFLHKKILIKFLNGANSIMPVIPSIGDLEELNDRLSSHSNSGTIDFIDQLQQGTGRTFGLIFRIATSKLSPLVDGAILNENYNKKLTISASSFGGLGNGVSSFSSTNGIGGNLLSIELITTYLSSIISIFQHRMVHFTLSQRFFNQVFCWIGALIMKGFMLRQTFCTESFAVFVKSKIDSLTKWADEVGNVWVGEVGNAFQQVREVIAVLNYKDKEKIIDERTRKQYCPTLNSNQLKQVLSLFTPGEYGGKRVSAKVIASICPPSKSSASQSFVQDENKLNTIPIDSLHYLEIQDIQSLSLPFSIRQTIENEIINLKQQVACKK